jgi:TBC1 domain family member 14
VDEARLLREIAIEQRIPQWDKEVLPDWKAVFREPALRKLWWNGIPAKMRGQLWASSIGNALALGKGEI